MPVLLLTIQVIAAVVPARREGALPATAAHRPRVAVLVPAHDEAAGIATALRTMREQLGTQDRLLVVADNCTDDTARMAAEAGAEVVERCDPAHRGKGYALDFGIRHLESTPPEVVVIIDADCHLHAGSLDRLAWLCESTGRPVQALDIMEASPNAGLKTRIASFAWVVKNHTRPLGYHRLGLPCQLMGTGMAFPWELIRRAPLASGDIVEDMRLGLDLAEGGAPPLFCEEALVTSVFPEEETAARSQRTRWEHGHFAMITSRGLPVLGRALSRRRFALAAMALDLCVPPLASLVLMLLVGTMVATMVVVLHGSTAALSVFGVDLVLLALAVGAAWWRFGRRIVSFRELLSVPVYVLAKLPIYLKLFTARQMEWIRTKRDH